MEYIYILTNHSFPDLVKVGFTTRSPMERASELSRATGIPTPFNVFHSWEVKNARNVERKIHKALDRYREAKNKEFFKISPGKCKEIILENIKAIKDAEDIYFSEKRNLLEREYQRNIELERERKIKDETLFKQTIKSESNPPPENHDPTRKKSYKSLLMNALYLLLFWAVVKSIHFLDIL